MVLGARLAENGLGYLFPVFGLSYVITTLGAPQVRCARARTLAFVIQLFMIVGFATLSDCIGRRPVVFCSGRSPASSGRSPSSGWPAPRMDLIAVAFIGARAVVTAAMFGPQAAYFANCSRRSGVSPDSFAREQARCWPADPRRSRPGTGGVVRKLVAGRMSRGPAGQPAPRSDPERLRDFEERITVDNKSDAVLMNAATRRHATMLREPWCSNFDSCSRSGPWSDGVRTKRRAAETPA